MERGTILVVDDEPNIADLVDLYLAREGYRCYAIVRSLGRRYPARPFVRVHDADEFVSAGMDLPSGLWEGDRDFIFVQPASDVLDDRDS